MVAATAVARGTLARPSKARKQEAAKHKAAAGAVVCRQCAAAARPRRRELKPVRRQFYTRRRHPLRCACAEKITLSSMRNSTRYSSSLDGRVRLHSLENLYVRARAVRPPLPPPRRSRRSRRTCRRRRHLHLKQQDDHHTNSLD